MKKLAFTMAEILLSLTIIGVVAAITLPSLTGNINERTWNTQRKALYARMSQAVALMPALNGFGILSNVGTSSAVDTAGETFIASGLSKVLKINNICDKEHIEDCGFPTAVTTLGGNAIASFPRTMEDLNSKMTSAPSDDYATSLNQTNTQAVAFETQNGESILAFYNPNCKDTLANIENDSKTFMQPFVCVNFVYDLNGSKGPNTVGKDIGVITVFNSSDSTVVAPMPYNKVITASDDNATSVCTTEISGGEYRLPNYLEATSIWVNKSLFDWDNSNPNIFTQTQKMKSDGLHRRVIGISSGMLISYPLGAEGKSFCIKR